MLHIATSTASAGPLSADVPAPGLSLRSTDGEIVSLRDLRGRAVILAFYPAEINPGADGILTALEAMQAKEVTR